MLSARNPHECPEPAETVWNFPSGAPVCPKVLLPQQVIVLSARTRVLFLLSRIPTRRPRRVRLCVHSSHACSNPWSLRKTQGESETVFCVIHAEVLSCGCLGRGDPEPSASSLAAFSDTRIPRAQIHINHSRFL